MEEEKKKEKRGQRPAEKKEIKKKEKDSEREEEKKRDREKERVREKKKERSCDPATFPLTNIDLFFLLSAAQIPQRGSKYD